MKFEKYFIADEIKQNLAKLGFVRPTDIQFKCIPNILKGEDLLAIAQTGTGKTAAFVIPILHLLHVGQQQKREDGIRCIVLVPTRELAHQIGEVFLKLGKNTRVNTMALHGGVEQDPQIAKLEKGIDVLIATPGRLFDLVSQGYIRLNRVQLLVLDEADHMLNLGFIQDIRQLIRMLPRKRQTLFFSATIDQEIKDLAYSLVVNPIRIQVSPKDPVSKNVDHFLMYVDMDDKRFFMERLIKEFQGQKILVFVRTKVRAERVVKAMERVGIVSGSLHGGMDQAMRTRVLNEFRTGQLRVMVATDVSARGIDIPDVDVVLNYDLPEISETYVHRVGRTGRGTRRGVAYSFCAPEEKKQLEALAAYLGYMPREMEIHADSYREVKLFSEENPANLKDILKMVGAPVKKKGKKG